MLNACDAFAFVRQQAVESPRGKEKALEARIKEFDTEVHSSKAINDAQDTVQWLSGSLSELRNAEADLLDTENKPIVPEPGESPESVAEKEQLKEEDVADKTENVEALSVKAQEEQLETKIAEELEKISVAFAEILSRYEDIMDSLLAKRLDHIGSIRVGTKGRETARMLVELQNALDEARHFGWVYSNENKQIRWQGQADRAVEDAKAELAAAANARAATKGRRALTLIKSMSDLPGPEDPRLSGKTFVQPTSELFQAA